MIGWSDINSHFKVMDVTSNKLVADKWFIGSALMGIDFRNLAAGNYFYSQDTIWTRMLDISEINPYWEIHNVTSNYLSVDNNDGVSVLISILQSVRDIFSIAPVDIIVVGNDMSTFNDYGCCTVFDNVTIPFLLDDTLVGTYLKVFVRRANRYYPLFDCTQFRVDGKQYFEINMNTQYLEVALEGIASVFHSTKYTDVNSNLLGRVPTVDELKTNNDLVRGLSLLECLAFIGKANVLPNASYLGHSTKKILKKFAITLLKLELVSSSWQTLLPDMYVDHIYKQIEAISKLNISAYLSHDKFTLADRYGITPEVFDFKTGVNERAFTYAIDSIRYFTDLPFLEDAVELDQFETVIRRIVDRKVRTKS